MVFARRLSTLLEAKGPFTVDTEGCDLLKLYEEEAYKQRKEMEKWRLRSELLLQLAGNPASEGVEVNSDVGSSRSSSISFATGISDFNSDIANLEDVEQVLQEISKEELEKHFYGLCVRAKLLLPKDHACQGLSVSKLYASVQSENIPVSKWREYISRIIGNLN